MVIKNNSDKSGRALEYIITKLLLIKNKNIRVLGSTLVDQERDKPKFESLSPNQQENYINGANELITWLDSNFNLFEASNISLERLSDNHAKKGDVTDIRLIINQITVNLSVKHNHNALKHQRPSALAQHCGFDKNSPTDQSYRKKYKKVTDTFLEQAFNLKKGVILFSELKEKNELFINKTLYKPVCEIVSRFINLISNNEVKSQFLFNFLVGNTNYFKVVLYNNHLVIKKFASLPKVDSLRATTVGDSYIELLFSNDWLIKMRLHTASSRLKGVSLKFDTQPVKIDVTEENIKF